MTRARAAVLVLAGLMLAACGNIHPGAAAVVDDQTISMKTLNQTAEVYCLDSLRAAKEQGATPPADYAAIRGAVVTNLVSLVVARKLAAEEGVTPKPAAYEVPESAEDDIAKSYKGVDVEVVVKTLEDYQELSQIRISLGEKVTGQAATEQNAQQLFDAGQAEIAKAFKANDVEFAPRFGLSNSGADKVATTGSLSVAPADLGEDKPDKLPASQRCS